MKKKVYYTRKLINYLNKIKKVKILKMLNLKLSIEIQLNRKRVFNRN